ncbi:MAG: hypothetical protein ABSA18_10065 [Dehalococcoidia bacterium]
MKDPLLEMHALPFGLNSLDYTSPMLRFYSDEKTDTNIVLVQEEKW